MDTLINLLVSLTVAIVTAYITVQLSLKQFYSQKWWERKSEAYSDVIEKLSFMQYFFGEIWDSRTLLNGPSNESIEKLRREYFDTLASLKKSAASVAFVISEKAANEIKKLIERLTFLDEDWLQKIVDEPPEGYNDERFMDKLDAVEKTIATVRRIAEKDLSKR